MFMRVYNFSEVLDKINVQYQLVHNTISPQPTGIKYFRSMERLVGLNRLDRRDIRRVIPYLSRN